MSNEELNKKIEFIIEQQAKFVVDVEILREIQAGDSRRFSHGLLALVGIVGSLTRAQMHNEENLQLLAESQRSMLEAQTRTDERLNIFINVVERYMSGNGGSERHA